jgi:hypothetical protein
VAAFVTKQAKTPIKPQRLPKAATLINVAAFVEGAWMPFATDEKNARVAGRNARRIGRPIYANPHIQRAADAWKRGWLAEDRRLHALVNDRLTPAAAVGDGPNPTPPSRSGE